LHDSPSQNQALISALMDGELRGQELDQALSQLDDDPIAFEVWDAYHRVGDALRSTQARLSPHDPQFLNRLRAALHEGPTQSIVSTSIAKPDHSHLGAKVESANDGWWKQASWVASVALVSVFVWQAYGVWGSSAASGATPVLAQRPTPMMAIAASTPERPATAVMIRDARLDALLSAHREFGGTSALQMPSGFLRNATFEEGRP